MACPCLDTPQRTLQTPSTSTNGAYTLGSSAYRKSSLIDTVKAYHYASSPLELARVRRHSVSMAEMQKCVSIVLEITSKVECISIAMRNYGKLAITTTTENKADQTEIRIFSAPLSSLSVSVFSAAALFSATLVATAFAEESPMAPVIVTCVVVNSVVVLVVVVVVVDDAAGVASDEYPSCSPKLKLVGVGVSKKIMALLASAIFVRFITGLRLVVGFDKIATEPQKPRGGVHAPFRASANDKIVMHMTNIKCIDGNIVANMRFVGRRDVFLQKCRNVRTMRSSAELCLRSLKYLFMMC